MQTVYAWMDSNRNFRAVGFPDRSQVQQRVRLTAKEVRLILLLREACTIEEMAKKTGMAHRTVKAHFNRIYIKFGIGGKWVKSVRLLYILNFGGEK